MDRKFSKALLLIADAVESGYSALFTFAVRESLTMNERAELVRILQQLAEQEGQENLSEPRKDPTLGSKPGHFAQRF